MNKDEFFGFVKIVIRNNYVRRTYSAIANGQRLFGYYI